MPLVRFAHFRVTPQDLAADSATDHGALPARKSECHSDPPDALVPPHNTGPAAIGGAAPMPQPNRWPTRLPITRYPPSLANPHPARLDRKSTRLNSSHVAIS